MEICHCDVISAVIFDQHVLLKAYTFPCTCWWQERRSSTERKSWKRVDLTSLEEDELCLLSSDETLDGDFGTLAVRFIAINSSACWLSGKLCNIEFSGGSKCVDKLCCWIMRKKKNSRATNTLRESWVPPVWIHFDISDQINSVKLDRTSSLEKIGFTTRYFPMKSNISIILLNDSFKN